MARYNTTVTLERGYGEIEYCILPSGTSTGAILALGVVYGGIINAVESMVR